MLYRVRPSIKRLFCGALMAVAIAAPVVIAKSNRVSAQDTSSAAQNQTRMAVCTQFYRGGYEADMNYKIQVGKQQSGTTQPTEQYYVGLRQMYYDALLNGCPALYPKLHQIIKGETYATSHNPDVYYLITGIKQ
jgi:hypothetical protein